MTKTAKLLLQEAQDEALQIVTKNRINLLHALDEAEEIHADGNYDSSILGVLSEFSGKLKLLKLQKVFPDTEELKKSRKRLRDAGKITEDTKGTTVLITLVQPVPESPEDAPAVAEEVPAPDAPAAAAELTPA